MPTATDPATIHCPKCRYNLTGLTRDVCPECGEAFDAVALRQRTHPVRSFGYVPLLLVVTPMPAFFAPFALAISSETIAQVTAIILFVASVLLGCLTAIKAMLVMRSMPGFNSTIAQCAFACGLILFESSCVVTAAAAGLLVAVVLGFVPIS